MDERETFPHAVDHDRRTRQQQHAMRPRRTKTTTDTTASSLRLLKKQLKRVQTGSETRSQQGIARETITRTPTTTKHKKQKKKNQQKHNKQQQQRRKNTSDVIAQNLSYLQRM